MIALLYTWLHLAGWWEREIESCVRASPGPGTELHPACAVYIYLLDCPQWSSIFLISTRILPCLFKRLRRAWQSDSAFAKKKKKESCINFTGTVFFHKHTRTDRLCNSIRHTSACRFAKRQAMGSCVYCFFPLLMPVWTCSSWCSQGKNLYHIQLS